MSEGKYTKVLNELIESIKDDPEKMAIMDENLKSAQEGSVDDSDMSDEVLDIIIALDEYVRKHNGNAYWYVRVGNIDEQGGKVCSTSNADEYIDVRILELEELLETYKGILASAERQQFIKGE